MSGFVRSFRYALRGLRLCLLERNFRFHTALAAYMFGYLLLYDWFELNPGAWAVLILSTALVLGAEALNTAIEAVVDLASPEPHPLAARAKDAAAGGVLLCAMGAVAAGIAVLWQPEAFRALAAYYRQKPVMLAVLALSLCGTALFVFPHWKKRIK